MKQIIYCDMDGVLADFNSEPNGVERFKNEKGFFKNLKPLKKNISAINKLIRKKQTIYILSASPNHSADMDKIEWVKKYLPKLAIENIILCRNGQKKVDFMLSENGVLFDDYGKNCREWTENKDNKAYKIYGDGDIQKYIELGL